MTIAAVACGTKTEHNPLSIAVSATTRATSAVRSIVSYCCRDR
jgi:hypothetical protein